MRQDDAAQGETHRASPQRRARIAQIARGNDVGRLCSGAFGNFKAGSDVVNHLRQQAADIDAVSGAEAMLATQ